MNISGKTDGPDEATQHDFLVPSGAGMRTGMGFMVKDLWGSPD
jgi:hypothetical protein